MITESTNSFTNLLKNLPLKHFFLYIYSLTYYETTDQPVSKIVQGVDHFVGECNLRQTSGRDIGDLLKHAKITG